ncbi:NAD(P)-binding protein [Durotheca rogersii]|uniref:NAD(P)-binding protein n=1 Tax=Durotheca rogersii TaxID=419775 RepID=UPI00221EDA40|nr:NAD(P)-binding protein [Durotheca rogersii]KAI5859275.1 NAD(P)-binding protein [Durotheca rogersii]
MEAASTVASILWYQLTFKPKPLPADVKLDGKTAIVTGSNVGLGFEAAKELAAHGLSRLILAVRSPAKGEEARASIVSASPKCSVEVWQLDQESPESILAFARKAQGLDRLDILLLNAGMKRLDYSKSPTGHETHVQVNYLGPALLSLILLDPLRRASALTGTPARITFTTSSLAFLSPVQDIAAPSSADQQILPWLDDPASFQPGPGRYSLSKLLLILWARELAAHTDASEILVNMVNPGWCMTEFHRADPSSAAAGRYLAWSADVGARFLTDAVVAHPDSHGAYLSEQAVKPFSKFVLSAEGQAVQKKLWNETLAALEEYPESKVW